MKDETNASFIISREMLRPHGFSILRWLVCVQDAAAKFDTFGRQFPREAAWLVTTGCAWKFALIWDRMLVPSKNSIIDTPKIHVTDLKLDLSSIPSLARLFRQTGARLDKEIKYSDVLPPWGP